MNHQDISVLNQNFGICGFVACLGALYQENSSRGTAWRQQVEGINNNQDELNTKIKMRITPFLNKLEKASGNSPLVTMKNDVKEFTNQFDVNRGNFENINLRTAAYDGLARESDGFVGVAMTPEAMVYYLKKYCSIYGVNIGDQIVNGRAIYGLGRENGQPELYNNLRHWVYCSDQEHCFNYGQIQTLDNAMNDYPIISYALSLN